MRARRELRSDPPIGPGLWTGTPPALRRSKGSGSHSTDFELFLVAEMATPSIDELLATIRRLPLDERRRLIERAVRETDEDTPKPPAVGQSSAPSLLGLMADEPDVVDQVCTLAYEARNDARMRSFDE